MKKNLLVIATLVLLLSGIGNAQYKDTEILKPGVKSFIVDDTDSFLFGLFDPSRFSMHHSYSMSYSAGGGNGIALGVYTNSMFFKLADNMNLQFDASLTHSPYSSFGNSFTNDITGFRLSRAQLNYKPWKNFSVSLSYQQLPSSYYGYGFGDNYFGNNSFFEPGWNNTPNPGN